MQGRLRSRLILLLFFFFLTKARPRGTLIAAAIMKASPVETFFDSPLLSVSFNVQIVCATLQIKQTNRLQANKSFTLRLRTCKGIRIPESGKYLLVESRFHNTAQGIRNPTRDWNSLRWIKEWVLVTCGILWLDLIFSSIFLYFNLRPLCLRPEPLWTLNTSFF